MSKHIAEQFNLPFEKPKYPHSPGYKNKQSDGPSAQAAREVAATAPTLRELCLQQFAIMPMTADEVAERLDRSILSIRPRIAELSKLQQIEDTGKRRQNSSGKQATVWRFKH